jgi:hypothetical protein
LGCSKDADASTRKFLGQMDELFIHQRALNSAEIKSIMDNGYNTLPTDTKDNFIVKVSVRPNPVRDRMYIDNAENAKVEISDMRGNMVLNESYSSDGIDVSKLVNGMYIVKVTTDSGVNVLKVQILK